MFGKKLNILSKNKTTIIYLCLFLIYVYAPIKKVYDSKYSLLLSYSLVFNHSFYLDKFNIPGVNFGQFESMQKEKIPYQLEVVNGHLYYSYPIGSPILSLPFIPILKIFGIAPVDKKGNYNPKGEITAQKIIAAVLMTLLVFIIYKICLILLPKYWCIAVTFMVAIGSQILSSASRAVWADTGGIFILSIIIYFLVRRERDRYHINPYLLGTLVSFLYFCKPIYSTSIVFITIYLFITYRDLIYKYLMVGGFWLFIFIIYSYFHFNSILPSYYKISAFSINIFPEALLGHFFSPSRGFFVFYPIAIIFLFLLLFYIKKVVRESTLVLVALAIVIIHVVIISSWVVWWAGHSYGPRLWTSVLPWIIMICIYMLNIVIKNGLKFPKKLAISLSIITLLIHIRGAFCPAVVRWNIIPFNVDSRPERVWNWRYPQFLAGIISPPPLPSGTFPDYIIGLDIRMGHKEFAPFLLDGWGPITKKYRCVNSLASIGFNIVEDIPKRIIFKCKVRNMNKLLCNTICKFYFNNRQNVVSLSSFNRKTRKDILIKKYIPGTFLKKGKNIIKIEVTNSSIESCYNGEKLLCFKWLKFSKIKTSNSH